MTVSKSLFAYKDGKITSKRSIEFIEIAADKTLRIVTDSDFKKTMHFDELGASPVYYLVLIEDLERESGKKVHSLSFFIDSQLVAELSRSQLDNLLAQ